MFICCKMVFCSKIFFCSFPSFCGAFIEQDTMPKESATIGKINTLIMIDEFPIFFFILSQRQMRSVLWIFCFFVFPLLFRFVFCPVSSGLSNVSTFLHHSINQFNLRMEVSGFVPWLYRKFRSQKNVKMVQKTKDFEEIALFNSTSAFCCLFKVYHKNHPPFLSGS